MWSPLAISPPLIFPRALVIVRIERAAQRTPAIVLVPSIQYRARVALTRRFPCRSRGDVVHVRRWKALHNPASVPLQHHIRWSFHLNFSPFVIAACNTLLTPDPCNGLQHEHTWLARAVLDVAPWPPPAVYIRSCEGPKWQKRHLACQSRAKHHHGHSPSDCCIASDTVQCPVFILSGPATLYPTSCQEPLHEHMAKCRE